MSQLKGIKAVTISIALASTLSISANTNIINKSDTSFSEEYTSYSKDKSLLLKKRYKKGNLQIKETYINDILHGESLYYINGLLFSKAVYKDGKLNGKSTKYYPNGAIEFETHYKNGKLHGTHTHYSRTGGVLTKREYINNIIVDGTYISNYENEMISIEENYKNGKLHGYYTYYYPTGEILTKLEYQDGIIIDGVYVSNRKNKQINKITTYKDGEIKKIIELYHDSDKLYETYYNKHGKEDGTRTIYLRNGKIKSQEIYKDGKLIKKLSKKETRDANIKLQRNGGYKSKAKKIYENNNDFSRRSSEILYVKSALYQKNKAIK